MVGIRKTGGWDHGTGMWERNWKGRVQSGQTWERWEKNYKKHCIPNAVISDAFCANYLTLTIYCTHSCFESHLPDDFSGLVYEAQHFLIYSFLSIQYVVSLPFKFSPLRNTHSMKGVRLACPNCHCTLHSWCCAWYTFTTWNTVILLFIWKARKLSEHNDCLELAVGGRCGSQATKRRWIMWSSWWLKVQM